MALTMLNESEISEEKRRISEMRSAIICALDKDAWKEFQDAAG